MKPLLPFLSGGRGLKPDTLRGSGANGSTRTESGDERPFIEMLENGKTTRTAATDDTRSSSVAKDRSGRPEQNPSRDPEHDGGPHVAVNALHGAWSPLTALATLGPGGTAGLLLPGVSSGQNSVPANLAQQIQIQVQNFVAEHAQGSGPSTLTLKLNPDHLGFLQVDFTPAGNRLKVAMSTASPETEAILKEDLNRLTDALLNRVGRFQQVEVKVELKSNPAEDAAQEDQEPRQGRDQSDGHPHQEQLPHRGREQAFEARAFDEPRKEG